MQFIVYTASDSFKKYFAGLVEQNVEFHTRLTKPAVEPGQVYFLHISSLGPECYSWLKEYALTGAVTAGLCSDKPDIREMLEGVRVGAKAYCNSYMQTAHYVQLIRLVSKGQSWFPPELLSQTFELAHKAVHGNDVDALLKELTSREKEIAIAISKGFSNSKIAQALSISEPTVKTHLTNIFKKLQLKDRVALVLYLKQS